MKLYSKQKKHTVVLHFEKPYEDAIKEAPQLIESEIEEMKKICKGRITFQTDKKTGYKKIAIVCEEKPNLESE